MLLKVATRKSPLAIKQSEMVCDWLSARLCEHTFELYPVSTEIDSRLDYSLEKQGGIGLFTKELDAALIEGQAEIAVHSAKDLPVELPASLKIIGYLPRDSVADILISKKDWDSIERIATSSPRRRHQLSAIFPKAQFQLIRGNVETRLNKICNDEADATILAEAGLDRLNIANYKDLVFTNLEHEIMVPAAGQGAAGVYFDGKQLHIYHPVIAYRSFEIKETSLSGKLESAISLMKEIKTEINK